LLKIEAWMPSEIKAISPLVDRLMRLIEGSRCVAGNERAVELALREALSNAVVHGNQMDAHKLVQIRCGCRGPSPEDVCLQRERERILSAGMNELTPGIRKAVELRELGELSTGETAQVMGLSVAAVKGRVFHGRRKLRETLRRHVESGLDVRKTDFPGEP
jgi:DNA-directed RNA polymerase specialized sigma24 family protein